MLPLEHPQAGVGLALRVVHEILELQLAQILLRVVEQWASLLVTLQRVQFVKELLTVAEKPEVVFQLVVGDLVVEDLALVEQNLQATVAPQLVAWPLLLEEEPCLLEIQTAGYEEGQLSIADQEMLVENVQ